MAYNSFGWGQVKATPVPVVPLKPGPDPEHLNPTPNLRYDDMNPLWRDSSGGVPTLPYSYTSDDGVAVIIAPGGPVNREPEGGQYGVSTGPGLTTGEAMEIREAWGNTDLGAVAALNYVAMTDRDGTPQHALIDDIPGEGTSPETLAYKITGVGGTNDPYARTGKRLQRTWARRWDMHWYDVETRPATLKNAKTAQAQPAVANPTQYDSPYSTAATAWGTFQPEVFVAPQERRVPQPWDQAITSDGSAMVPDQAQLWSM